MESQSTEYMLLHIYDFKNIIYSCALKTRTTSNFKIKNFWRFFHIEPSLSIDLGLKNYIFTNLRWFYTFWQNFIFLAIRLPFGKSALNLIPFLFLRLSWPANWTIWSNSRAISNAWRRSSTILTLTRRCLTFWCLKIL